MRQALVNATSVLAEAGATLADVVKATIFIVDMNEFAACNEVWLGAFSEPLPTRSTVAVADLPRERPGRSRALGLPAREIVAG